MVSMPSREALRTNKQMFLEKFIGIDPVQHPVFCANPQDWEYTPGYVFVDAGNKVFLAVLKLLEQHEI